MTPPYDPRGECQGGCGRKAIDGKATCGDVACGPSTGSADAVRAGAMWRDMAMRGARRSVMDDITRGLVDARAAMRSGEEIHTFIERELRKPGSAFASANAKIASDFRGAAFDRIAAALADTIPAPPSTPPSAPPPSVNKPTLYAADTAEHIAKMAESVFAQQRGVKLELTEGERNGLIYRIAQHLDGRDFT